MCGFGQHRLITLAVAAMVALSGAVTPVLVCSCLSHVGPVCCAERQAAVGVGNSAEEHSDCCAGSRKAPARDSEEGESQLTAYAAGILCGCLHNAPTGRIPSSEQANRPPSGPSGETSLSSVFETAAVQLPQTVEHSPPVLARQDTPKYLSQCALIL